MLLGVSFLPASPQQFLFTKGIHQGNSVNLPSLPTSVSRSLSSASLCSLDFLPARAAIFSSSCPQRPARFCDHSAFWCARLVGSTDAELFHFWCLGGAEQPAQTLGLLASGKSNALHSEIFPLNFRLCPFRALLHCCDSCIVAFLALLSAFLYCCLHSCIVVCILAVLALLSAFYTSLRLNVYNFLCSLQTL
jgi:hypothetical protein